MNYLRHMTPNSSQPRGSPAGQDSHQQPSALDDLQSDAQQSLLDTIDRLRSQLSGELDLPQLIVCGNQSSGKSSVLEAISRVSFPAANNTTTRFASEIVLRRSPVRHTNISIQPTPGTSQEDEEYFQQFQPDMDPLQDFTSIVILARDHLDSRMSPQWTFCEHRLRVEISGPDQPHLTLVDLPGLIQTTNDPSAEADIEMVQAINRSYMQQPRSVILAVMSAQNDLQTQPVFQMARRVDPNGMRTMGILTKPDLVERGTEGDKLRLARNEGDIELELGWHVLRNRTVQHASVSSQERDELELRFFDDPESPWSELPEHLRGARSLRHKLSNTLFDIIVGSLPQIREEIQTKMEACTSRLNQLGDPRPEESQQRLFLTDVSLKLGHLISQALDGQYSDPFFGDNSTAQGKTKRLGTRLASQGRLLAAYMNIKAKQYHIINDGSSHCSMHHCAVFDDDFRFVARSSSRRMCVTRIAAIKATMAYVEESRSRGLPGDIPIQADADIFRVQSRSWERLARMYAKNCVEFAQQFLQIALQHVAPAHTATMIMSQIGEAKIADSSALVHAKVDELITPWRKSFLMTENPRYSTERNRLQGLQHDLQASNPDIYADLRSSSDFDAAVAILNRVEAYYNVSQYTFVDNVVTLAVDNCIVEPLKTFFEARGVATMDTEQLALLGSEPPRVTQERERDRRRYEELSNGLRECNRHAGMAYVTNSTSASGQPTNSIPDPSIQPTTAGPANGPTTPINHARSDRRSQPASVSGGLHPDFAMRTPPRTPSRSPRIEESSNSGQRARQRWSASVFEDEDE